METQHSRLPAGDGGVDVMVGVVQTRDVLGLAISASLNAPISATRFGVFRM